MVVKRDGTPQTCQGAGRSIRPTGRSIGIGILGGLLVVVVCLAGWTLVRMWRDGHRGIYDPDEYARAYSSLGHTVDEIHAAWGEPLVRATPANREYMGVDIAARWPALPAGTRGQLSTAIQTHPHTWIYEGKGVTFVVFSQDKQVVMYVYGSRVGGP